MDNAWGEEEGQYPLWDRLTVPINKLDCHAWIGREN